MPLSLKFIALIISFKAASARHDCANVLDYFKMLYVFLHAILHDLIGCIHIILMHIKINFNLSHIPMLLKKEERKKEQMC